MSESPFAPGADAPNAAAAIEATGQSWPKISIFDFMVWMFFSAAFLALYDSRDFEGSVKLLFRAQQIAYGITAGAQLAALLAVFRHRNSRSFGELARQPGHWLLISPVSWLVMLLIDAVGRFLAGGPTTQWGNWVYVLGSIVTAIAWGFACRHFRGRWRKFFFVSVVVAILGSVSMLLLSTAIMQFYTLLEVASLILNICLVVMLFWILFAERSMRASRSWMHWIGVIGWLILQLWGFLFRILWQVFQS